MLPRKRKQLDGRQKVMLDFAKTAAERGQHFFYIRIPESLSPHARDEKYEEPLNNALGELGEITGRGSQLGEGNSIAFCGFDIVVNHREQGLKIIRQCLRSCSAPPNTIIEEYMPDFAELPL